ncbi:MAG: Gp15 family bacteriophage protein, partial [Lachnospiraceae bacterium]|nr:Gp15 family bacteriophage protein [Lachnospiraceae bacterium]
MMNLTKQGLPNVVEINGSPYSIYTDFRLWMRFEIEVSRMKHGDNIEIGYLFKNEHPTYCNITDLLAFSRPYSPLPRQVGSSDVIVIDYELDADRIYAAFLGQYGIDLIDIQEL